MSKRPFTIRLFNTVEPVNSFYRDLIPCLQEQGWRVEVIISRAQYRSGRQSPWIMGQTRVHWTPDLGQNTGTRFGKLLIMITYGLFAVIRTLFGRTVDRNLFLTQPPLFYLWGSILKKVRGQSYFIVLMDIYPDIAVQAGLFSAGSMLTRFLTRLARFGLQHADGVIVIGRCMQKKVLGMGVPPERIHLIPNWGDPQVNGQNPGPRNKFREEHHWQDKFIILYSGNIGTSHYFDDLLEVARRLRDHPDLLFVFIGNGARHKEIEAYKNRHALANVALLPFQPQERLPETLSAGDVHFVSVRDGFTGLVVPSKVYGIMAAGRPVLYQGVSWGEIALLAAEEDIGCVIPLRNPDALESALLTYVADSALIHRQGEKASRLINGIYGRTQACAAYSAVLCTQPG
jgi:glycosyltransferase involved in cell wall biosynthesis